MDIAIISSILSRKRSEHAHVDLSLCCSNMAGFLKSHDVKNIERLLEDWSVSEC